MASRNEEGLSATRLVGSKMLVPARRCANGSATIPLNGMNSGRRYFAELQANPSVWRPITEAARRGTVTLIYSSHDEEHNNAVALQEFLKRHIKRK